jgi:hypothetical protein
VAALPGSVAVTSAGTAVVLCASYLALGGALFVALLLQAVGGGGGTGVACGAALKLEPAAFCPAARAAGFSSMQKRTNLDAWRRPC